MGPPPFLLIKIKSSPVSARRVRWRVGFNLESNMLPAPQYTT